ncbi:acyl-CoA-like ligand-binding transcription factor [Streptomyces triticirhizae]|uniref:TetR family transcriptional regulator n=1 Tax=Streptomyces triticirhizae TaxID=2483353 RepID=A0A3M2LJG2_9ACTN|nr:TetR family transcriptional regulator [Streptomyces triticirhizae]RMI37617.1 TetR family transcriptional regulator [Streptomyces triticirhizae]
MGDQPGTELGLRGRKKLATRRALSEAALRLAAERGLENVLVEDIAAAVGVSPRTFNNYFSSKQEAIVSLVVARAAGLCDAVAAQPPEMPLWEAIAEAAIRHVRPEESEQWRLGALLIRDTPALEAEQLRAYAGIESSLAVVIAARTGTDPRAALFPGLAASVAVGAIRAALRHWLDAGGDRSYPDLLRQVLRGVGAGLGEPGRPDHRLPR